MDNNMEKQDAEYLKTYRFDKYEKPSVATDIAILSIMEEAEDNYRKNPEKHLKLLMIKRGKPPYQDKYALPGGFLQPNETVEQAATRELKEETGVDHVHLEQVKVFSQPGRDPRGWIISDVFMALIDGKRCEVNASTDAKEAAWFTVTLRKQDEDQAEVEQQDRGRRKEILSVSSMYQLKLTHEQTVLSASIEEKIEYSNYRKHVEYVVKEAEGFAFDHAEIIMHVIQYLRFQTNNSNIAFDLLPEYFTLTDLQKVYEVILDTKLLTANFRRKIAAKVFETELVSDGMGHRPAKLFRRNLEAFYLENRS